MAGQFLILMLLALFVGGMVSYVVGHWSKNPCKAAGVVALLALVLAVVAFVPVAQHVALGDTPMVTIGDGVLGITLQADALSVFMIAVILLLSIAATIYSWNYMEEDEGVDKYYGLLMFMITGMLGITLATDLFNIYLFFELMAVSSYVLVAFRKDTHEPIEAAFKYLVMSAVGSAFILLGIALTFMYTGELSFAAVAQKVPELPASVVILLMGLFLGGFGVKTAMAPLHTWLPDAHSAAPTGISAMLSGVVIETGFFAMLRILITLFAAVNLSMGLALALFSVVTMFAGNLLALVQKDIKRMLAYSSVAQIGYILAGIGLGIYFGAFSGLTGGLYHIMTHAFMKGLAFFCAGVVIHQLGTREIAKMRGIGRHMPLTAAGFTVAALALAGVPPFSGFMSKLLIYNAGVEVGSTIGITFAVLIIMNSIISLGYYLPVVNTFYAKDTAAETPLHDAPVWCAVPIGGLMLVTLLLGILPQIGLKFVYPAVSVIVSLLV
ncbi:MAG TPA: cation:proton antiporter [Clostridia bacterium]|nr:cation:proton antiporter [Clostridia bacterium]